MAASRRAVGWVGRRLTAAVKHGIDTGAGVVDADYRGLLGVVLFNFGAEDFQCACAALTSVHAGDRIAQLVLEKISTPEIEEVEVCSTYSRSRSKTRNGAAAALAPRAASGLRSDFRRPAVDKRRANGR